MGLTPEETLPSRSEESIGISVRPEGPCPPEISAASCGRDKVCKGNTAWRRIARLWNSDVVDDECFARHEVQWMPPPDARRSLLSYHGNTSVIFPPNFDEEGSDQWDLAWGLYGNLSTIWPTFEPNRSSQSDLDGKAGAKSSLHIGSESSSLLDLDDDASVESPLEIAAEGSGQWDLDSSPVGAGGASDAALFRALNGKLWVKEVSENDLAQWNAMRSKYVMRLMNPPSPTLLMRILGFVTVGEIKWMVMLVAAAPSNGLSCDIEPLTCDIKPHQLSASGADGDSSHHLHECNLLMQSRVGATSSSLADELLQVVEHDLAVLRHGDTMAYDSIDYSWILIRACDNDPGAYKIQGQTWHVALIDFLMAYAWLRSAENCKRQWLLPDTFPKFYQKWNCECMYCEGKYEGYADKQQQVFDGLVNKKPFEKFGKITDHRENIEKKCEKLRQEISVQLMQGHNADRCLEIKKQFEKWECSDVVNKRGTWADGDLPETKEQVD